jgi:hypothetical protein
MPWRSRRTNTPAPDGSQPEGLRLLLDAIGAIKTLLQSLVVFVVILLGLQVVVLILVLIHVWR